MIFFHLIALSIAIVIDSIIGDPPTWPHPVKWIGALIARTEKKWNVGSNKKLKGYMMLVSILLVVGGISFILVWWSYQTHILLGIAIESFMIATTIAQKSLKEAALSVYRPLDRYNLQEARIKLSYIVGRDTNHLDEAEITRATVETVAENTSDGITAPLFWALIGGAPFALLYRAINTCDSMVGYKNERYHEFGWASARLDDVVNWIPSRLTSFCMVLTNRPVLLTFSEAWKIVLRDARKHPSPNSGWGEAAVAAILGVQLGGTNYYKGIVSNRARMGEPILPLGKEHIIKTNRILTKTIPVFLLMLWLGGLFIELAKTWS
ncbi:adenosylcobinamide-phosphate synthase CbiB [Mesobacillus maritimus]|uniref:adenosylcobinamide-phosphate synthase CbiB n=1 Tax=Mesobacillus maritimus TaxID=1643336 RepID=UPI00203E0719|nr:adenosylcobinamide-phosphate synthase CbiB [Mesobacillus maritimus]MCM3584422.1 adenosylcobinamide-phosphate synthase CbiB [Mesobacillus maritimus]MCM3670845.1 adenosylcobinamide-phosphate synthase CbiB [Mesobacillus maritimus]